MCKKEENKDEISTSSRGLSKSEDLKNLRIEDRTEDQGFKLNCEDQAAKVMNLGNEILIENDCLEDLPRKREESDDLTDPCSLTIRLTYEPAGLYLALSSLASNYFKWRDRPTLNVAHTASQDRPIRQRLTAA